MAGCYRPRSFPRTLDLLTGLGQYCIGAALSAYRRYRITNTTNYASPLRLPHICLPTWLCTLLSSSYVNNATRRARCDHITYEYRKISNTIRTIFTKNRNPAAGVRIIHLNYKTHNFYYIFLLIFFILLRQHGVYRYNNRSALTPEQTE